MLRSKALLIQLRYPIAGDVFNKIITSGTALRLPLVEATRLLLMCLNLLGNLLYWMMRAHTRAEYLIGNNIFSNRISARGVNNENFSLEDKINLFLRFLRLFSVVKNHTGNGLISLWRFTAFIIM